LVLGVFSCGRHAADDHPSHHDVTVNEVRIVAKDRVTVLAMSRHMPSVEITATTRLSGESVFMAKCPFR
jgi:hypothetical protein